MLDLAFYAEESGFHGAHLDDHVQRLFDEQIMPFLEAMTTLTAFGVHTKKIRLGHITIFNSLRNLAYLAKTITTLDNMFKSRYGILPGRRMDEARVRRIRPDRSTTRLEKDRSSNIDDKNSERNVHQLRIYNKSRHWKLKKALNYPLSVQKRAKIILGAGKR